MFDEDHLAAWLLHQRLVTPDLLRRLLERRRAGDARRLDAVLREEGLVAPEHLQRYAREGSGALPPPRATTRATVPATVRATVRADEVVTAVDARSSSTIGRAPAGEAPFEPSPGRPLALRPGLEVVPERILGQGGMGVVWLVRDPALGRPAALKLVRGGGDAATRALRFQREKLVTARLDHPNIPPVYEAGQLASGHDYLLMRYVEGRSLAQALTGGGATRRDLLAALVSVARAVASAHSRGVVHRDLKPDNVMIGAFGEVLVMDWGLARDLSQSAQEDQRLRRTLAGGPQDTALTQEGAILGTLGYMAPEQGRGEDVDARADVWSLGALLVAVLTGEPPVVGESGIEALEATLAGRYELPRARDRSVAPELEAIAARALAPDPEDRYDGAEALADDLAAFLEGRAVSAHHYGLAERLVRLVRRHPVWTVAAALSFAALLALRFTGDAAAASARRSTAAKAAEQARAAWEAVLATPAPGDLVDCSPEERHALLERRAAAALSALGAAQHWHALAGHEPEAAAARARAAFALADAAQATGQWSLAEQALDDVERADVEVERARALRAALDEARTAEACRRREAVEGLLERAASGAMAREPAGLQEAVFELIRHGDPATAALLAARLDEVSAALEEAARAALREGAVPTADEARAGEAPVDVEAALARRAALPPGEQRAPEDDPALAAARARLERRGTLQGVLVAGAKIVPAGRLVAGRQADALGPRLDLARLCAEALGRLRLREGAVAALGRYLRAEEDEQRAIVAALALGRLGGAEALAYVREARRRFSMTFRLATRGLELGDDGPAATAAGDDPLARARELRDARRAEEALALVEPLLERGPDDAAAWSLKGACLEDLGRLEAACEAFDRAIDLAPDLADARAGRGQLRRRTGDRRGALADFDEAVALDPRRAFYRYYRGYLRVDAGDVQGALADETAALELDPTLAVAWALRGAIRAAAGDLERALPDLDRAVELDPSNVTALRNRAAVQLQAGRLAEAEADASRALERAPDQPETLALRAQARERRGDLPGARRDLDRLVELEPRASARWSARGRLRALQGDPGALDDLDRGIEVGPRDPRAWAERGVFFLQESRLAEAARDLERALELDPDQADAWANLGEVRLSGRQDQAALVAFDRALALDSTLPGAWAGRGRARAAMGDRGGLDDVRRGVEVAPRDGRIWVCLGELLLVMGHAEESVRALSKGIELLPGFAEALRLRARGHAARGRRQEALADLDQALRLAPTNAVYWVERAELRLETGDAAGARDDATRALELSPAAALAERARGLLSAAPR